MPWMGILIEKSMVHSIVLEEFAFDKRRNEYFVWLLCFDNYFEDRLVRPTDKRQSALFQNPVTRQNLLVGDHCTRIRSLLGHTSGVTERIPVLPSTAPTTYGFTSTSSCCGSVRIRTRVRSRRRKFCSE